MRIRVVLIPLAVVGAIAAVVTSAARSPLPVRSAPPVAATSGLEAIVAEVDAHLEARWQDENLTPAGPARDLQVLRRLSLALHGTIPSLEEIRAFEADRGTDRLGRWTSRMLADRRFADYFAERLARAFVGTEAGQFILFRRGRFRDWLSDELAANRPYDALVRQMVTEQGLWTGSPASNFITAAYANDQIDVNALAGRSVRAFLGQRIDCAQCHDHPFAPWKQGDFEGLAAFYGQARVTFAGVEDKTRAKGEPIEYIVEDRETLAKRTVTPRVPFHSEWLPPAGTRREQLAAWITHPENRRFERAIANRVWGLMFGRPLVEPVDDLPDPPAEPDLLDLLGGDFRKHGYDLQRLIRVIASTRAFRLDSSHSTTDDAEFDRLAANWGVFPLTRLRPEQVIGAMLQAASMQTIDRNSHVFVRTVRFFRENDFVKEYGDLGEDELEDRAGTIAQALLRMYGQLSKEIIEANPLNATSRIAGMAGTDARCLDALYLVCLTRRPLSGEAAALLPSLAGTKGETRQNAVEDILWPLFNCWEFSWNH